MAHWLRPGPVLRPLTCRLFAHDCGDQRARQRNKPPLQLLCRSSVRALQGGCSAARAAAVAPGAGAASFLRGARLRAQRRAAQLPHSFRVHSCVPLSCRTHSVAVALARPHLRGAARQAVGAAHGIGCDTQQVTRAAVPLHIRVCVRVWERQQAGVGGAALGNRNARRCAPRLVP